MEISIGHETPAGSTAVSRHSPLFTGFIYYVDTTDGSDTNDGHSPTSAFATISYAITTASAGDAITIKAGAYDEALVVNKNGMELWFEIGSTLVNTDTATQTILVSGNGCRIAGHLLINQSGQIGIKITGTDFDMYDIRILQPTIGVDCDGTRHHYDRVQIGLCTVTGFDLGSDGAILNSCGVMNNMGATRGYYLTSETGKFNQLIDCYSVGNGASSFHLVTGQSSNIIKDCVSGANDGRWIDVDEASLFSNFSFVDKVEGHVTLALGGGGGTAIHNMFKVTGSVTIRKLYGVIEDALTGTNTDCYVDVYSTNGATSLSKTTTLSLGAALAGATIVRLDKADKVLSFSDAVGGTLIDQIDDKKEGFRLVEDRTGAAHVATYIRFHHTGAAECTGVIHWCAEWTPVSEDGWLAPV